MATQQGNNFDWNAWNTCTRSVPAGLAVYLASQLIANAYADMIRFRNPKADDLRAILGDIDELRIALKAAAAERQRERGE